MKRVVEGLVRMCIIQGSPIKSPALQQLVQEMIKMGYMEYAPPSYKQYSTCVDTCDDGQFLRRACYCKLKGHRRGTLCGKECQTNGCPGCQCPPLVCRRCEQFGQTVGCRLGAPPSYDGKEEDRSQV